MLHVLGWGLSEGQSCNGLGRSLGGLRLFCSLLEQMLGCLNLVDKSAVEQYVLSCQDEVVGGISKFPGGDPDPLHTYLGDESRSIPLDYFEPVLTRFSFSGLAGLSLIGVKDLQPLHAALNISMRAFDRLQTLHVDWASAM